jgi:DeoR family transcriptional regulator, glycerol-3-phosphate regulon repressor
MDLSARQSDILALIKQAGHVGVDDLSARFEVSTQTIRKDLNELAQRGLAARVHGGARPRASIANVGYEERRLIASAEKSRIGQIAAGLIPNNCSVMLNIGTTTEQVARALHGHSDLVVISNNVNIINALTGTESKELILAGGTVRQSDGAIVGEAAVEFISRYKADFAVIGASAIDEDGAVLDFDQREVSVARAILRNARTRILVCDATKFDRSAPMRICDIADIDFFVTDRPPPPGFADACERGGTTILTTAG